MNRIARNDIAERHLLSRPADPVPAGGGAVLPRHRISADAGGQVLYLPATGIVLVAHRRIPGGWECVVLTDPTGTHPIGCPHQITDLDAETALPVPLGAPLHDLDADTFARVWLARIRAYAYRPYPNVERVHGAHLYAVARVIATDLRTPGSRTITWDADAHRQIALTTRVLPPGLRRLMATLARQRLITQIPGSPKTPPMLHLRMPEENLPDPGAHE